MATLEVRGRRSGRQRSFPVMVADYDGERYLVAMLGAQANWVANVRAAGGQAILSHGRRETVQLVAGRTQTWRSETSPAAAGPTALVLAVARFSAARIGRALGSP
jgi:deazaflavin-dependent oxidoreductase (nitroreductase family)